MNNNPIPLESDLIGGGTEQKQFLKHLIKLHTPNNGNLKFLKFRLRKQSKASTQNRRG